MFQLEKVLGVTVNSNGALASNSRVDLIAYPAGSTVVLMNTTNDQQYHIINPSKKAIKSLAFTSCGKYLVVSEHGKNAGFKIWNVDGDNTQIAEITQENGGMRCFAISPDDSCIVTFDLLSLNIWNWKENIKITSGKIDTDVRAVSFSEDGKYFVSAGNKNVKFWFLEETSLSGRFVDLNELKDISFCDIACGKGRCHQYTYGVTRKGIVCIFSNKQHLETWVELKTVTNCLIVSSKYVFVGCAEATIYCFDTLTLEYMFTLPKCHFLGVDICEKGSSKHVQEEIQYPDTIAMTFNQVTNTIACIYNDRSLYIWDLKNPEDTITESRSFLYHSNCIWDINVIPGLKAENCFLTCSSDNTIRLWNTGKGNLEKVVYLNEDYKYLKDVTRNKDDDVYYGVRCIGTSPDGQYVASGDRKGTIRIHEFPSLTQSLELVEHESEVLSLVYTSLKHNCKLLASAGKDKAICLFHVAKNYSLIQKILDHSSSVTTVKFADTNNGELKIISSSSDGDCIIRSLIFGKNNSISVITEYKLSLRKILYTIELDRDIKYLLLATQNLKIFDLNDRILIKKLKSPHKESFVFKVALDSSNKYIATSCLDKSIVVYDFESKNYLETMYSNLVTNLCFTNDCRRLIAVTGDGCIFIWKINNENEDVLEYNEELLPAWAKKVPTKMANIQLSTKSTVPRGKWATRMEETISIKSSYVSEESDISPQSHHSDANPYFKTDDAKNNNEKEAFNKRDGHEKFTANTSVVPTPPRRKAQKSNLKNMSAYSMSSDAINNKILQKNKVVNVRKMDGNAKMDRSLGSNLELRTPVNRKENFTGSKREKASQMIGQVKEKLENIEQRIQIKSKKSILNPSLQPHKGTWLLTYRSSVEDQNRANKSETASNSFKSDFDIETRSRRKPSKPINRGGKPIRNTGDTREDLTKKPYSTIRESPAENQVKYKLSLPKPHSLLRTATDSQIVLRRTPKNENNLAKLNKKLSASNDELNHSNSLQNVNISTVKITEQLCEKVASELLDTATKAVELYKKFSNETSVSNVNAMENLALSLVWAQIKLGRLNIKNI